MTKIQNSILFALVFILPLSAIAQEYTYVSDTLLVNFRTGPGNEYRIDKRLKSGARLTQLEVTVDGKWAKVRHNDGTEGYILTQYLLSEETGERKFLRAEKQRLELAKTNAELVKKNQELAKEAANFKSSTTDATKSNAALNEELRKIKTISAGAIELDKRHQALLEKHQVTLTERDALAAENESLKGDQRLSFMMYGAGILILGMLIAVILPAFSKSNKSSDWAN